MGLSAWKQYQATRWALRVNPSSGNLHPTEAYIVWNGVVHHYAPREHALEQRAAFVGRGLSAPPESVGQVPLDPPDPELVGRGFSPGNDDQWLLVGLSSIFWREAWKYGERAFRYCQHDLGHALGALRLSAARLGWRVHLLSAWSDAEIATLLGLDRDDDFANAEREAPECLAIVAPPTADVSAIAESARQLLACARSSPWTGTANRLSASHVEWSIIEQVANATGYPGGIEGSSILTVPSAQVSGETQGPAARAVMLQRRSAVAFDGRSSLPAATFKSMLARLQPSRPPWDVMPWPPRVHLALFVHRVDGLTPGIYALLRNDAPRAEWQDAMRPQFLWEPVEEASGLFLLLPFDMKWPATRVSCDQDIAGDGFFSLAMLAPSGDSPSNVRRVDLSASVLGGRAYRAGPLSRSRSGWRTQYRASAASTTMLCTSCLGCRSGQWRYPTERQLRRTGRACTTFRWACRSTTHG